MSLFDHMRIGAAGQGEFYPYKIDHSLRFNDDDSAHLARTFGSGDTKKWTYACWFKLGNITNVTLFGEYTGANDYTGLFLTGSHKLRFLSRATTNIINIDTDMLFRDPGNWYHLVVVYDSAQATEADRLTIYVNGTEQTYTVTTNIGLNETTSLNGANPHYIGRWNNSTDFFDGYMAEIHFVDGQALSATDFGEFKNGVWIPKEYAGTYGTNGFYLKFALAGNVSQLGTDSSGNSNVFTVNWHTVEDQVEDSPTNNWDVLNAVSKDGRNTVTLANGNLQFTGNATTASYTPASFLIPKEGKWYFEWTQTSSGTATTSVGLRRENADISAFSLTDFITYRANGDLNDRNTIGAYGATFTQNDVIGVAIDMDGDSITFYKNNTSQGVAATGFASDHWTAVVTEYGGAVTGTGDVNFGQLGFTYTPPTGFSALNSENLPEYTIGPAETEQASDHFNVVTWTGDDTTGRGITGVGFQPDFVWIKNRTAANSHLLYDAIRGAGNHLVSNTAGAEGTNATVFASFDSDGFTVGYDGTDVTNGTANDYVAWCWKANGAGSSNTDGTITSTVSANQTAGFSVVTYTGNGTAGATVGHGLGAVPGLIIVKNRDAGTDSWNVYHHENTSAPETDRLLLNATDATFDTVASWNDTAPTSSVFTVGNGGAVNANTEDLVAYVWAEVPGYSRFGSYTGNGSTDGPFVYCGFRPAFLVIKRTDSTGDWVMYDTARSTYNPDSPFVLSNSSAAENAGTDDQDLLSNGFKLRTTGVGRNANGGTYVFIAFAEHPFKHNNAR